MLKANPFNRLKSFIRINRFVRIGVILIFVLFLAIGCASYQVNKTIDHYSPNAGYRVKNMVNPESSENVLFMLSFSGGGTRAAALSYGLLEELARTEISYGGPTRRLLDEVDIMSGVSGGSFTAAYYGLFGDRIFEDFETKFLKKNIQFALLSRKFLFIPNWFRLISPYFASSDLAAEFYDKHVFDGGTFGDIAKRGGPAIIINATDLTAGTTFPFIQEYFDLICSDVSKYPVARAAAASSAVPVVLSPITLKNYTGRCDYQPEWINEALQEKETLPRRYHQAVHSAPYLELDRKPYVHLVDGGISDNLGIRAGMDRMTQVGNFWSSLKYAGWENTRKAIFILVNAETGVDKSVDLKKNPPGIFSVLSSITTTPISRYNFETIELMKLNFKTWAEDVRSGRCNDPDYKGDKASCDDIEFYLIELNFNNIPDEKEREFFKSLPTSFKLDDKTVDELREIAGRLLNQSKVWQRLLRDVQ